MFKVTNWGRYYKVSVGDHRPVKAYSIEGIQRAVEHYYGAGHYPIPNATCPFCQEIIARRTRRGEKA